MFAECLSAYRLKDNDHLLHKKLRIGIVGPCSAGKTTLIRGLTNQFFSARHIAQEHSYVPDMWKRLVNPDVLIYLDVSYQVSMQRRPLNLTREEFAVQIQRLTHARKGANFYLNTDSLSILDVLESVLDYLNNISKLD